MNKKAEFQKLISDLSAETSIEKIIVRRKGEDIDVGMINPFKLHSFIPNKWFDWKDYLDARIMIIGQDWGPYIALEKYFSEYDLDSKQPDFDYHKFLFKTFSSRTEKFIMKNISTTFEEVFRKEMKTENWKDVIFSIAVLFTRKGKHFRGNHNFDPKKSLEISYPYLARQIDIVKPRIIMTLGGMAFEQVNRKFKLGFDKMNLTSVFNSLQEKYLKTSDGTIIIPNFHPASYVKPEIMLKQFKLTWKIYRDLESRL